MACRNLEKAKSAAQSIRKKHPKAKLLLLKLDLNSLKSVKEFAKEIIDSKLPISILINNAGLAFCKASETNDGIETQFGVNFLGHYVLSKFCRSFPPFFSQKSKKSITRCPAAY